MSKWYKCEFYNHGITFIVNVFSESKAKARKTALAKIKGEINFDITWNKFGYQEEIRVMEVSKYD